MENDSLGAKIRKNIEASIEKAEKQRIKDLFQKRIELAKDGIRHFESKNFPKATECFLTYLRILEDWKKSGKGGLHPSLFDLQKDGPELLLISGVYWDLTKLYDRTNSPERYKDFKHFLNQYLIFSKGMSYESLSMETLRKYIMVDKPVHRKDFKEAYKKMGGKQCFVVTSLSDHTAQSTLPTLRSFRDEVLEESFVGQLFIDWYYANGPELAQAMNELPDSVRKITAKSLDGVAFGIRLWSKKKIN
ncbi:MAG: hypothetical protein CL678_08795 [Bdellovibrionaceae bacterium]|nr:hypothetical protein [Pseudobdellovibrionaceae bacterium]|tara:strand:- start:821 stop:1561 length:741 start_codon:yes stop_codon:yes gene_type:complete